MNLKRRWTRRRLLQMIGVLLLWAVIWIPALKLVEPPEEGLETILIALAFVLNLVVEIAFLYFTEPWVKKGDKP